VGGKVLDEKLGWEQTGKKNVEFTVGSVGAEPRADRPQQGLSRLDWGKRPST